MIPDNEGQPSTIVLGRMKFNIDTCRWIKAGRAYQNAEASCFPDQNVAPFQAYAAVKANPRTEV